MRRRQFLASLLSVAATPALAQRPQNVGRDVVGQSLEDILERGWIVFGLYDDFAPYSWEENGKPRGVDVEIGRLIAADLGVEPRFLLHGADETVDDDLRNMVWKGHYIGGRVANVMLRAPYNRELAIRNELVVLQGQYQNERIAIAYDAAFYEDEKPVPAYFRFDKVGVENDSIADFYLSGMGNGAVAPNIRRFRSPGLAMEAMKAGEVQAVMGAQGQLEWFAKDEDRLAVHAPPLPGLAVGEWTIGIAVRHNWRALGYAVDDAIRAAVQDGRMERIFADHGLSWIPPEW
ncbi:substrate-binding periplasmic protein [Rhodovulum sp. DZ06]|uniref:substrate-binding periplasmic protein n=1 Tax=Rhodovulum sp. DZ06 TaxID=3425126 RepID=UPI003D32BFCE